MKYDYVYTYVGQMGLFQKLVCAAIFFFSLFTLDAVQMIFVGADMNHWCLVPELSNLSYEQQKNIASPTLRYGAHHTSTASICFRTILQT